jgi:zinc protease
MALATCAKPSLVTEYELDNGLKVVIVSVPKAELVSLVTLYSIGEATDPRGKYGMAHLIEHLYVTSAAGEYPASTADRFMADHPKGWNAQTGMDYTVFATVFPQGRLDAELGMAAARMKSLNIAQADLDREIPRIESELKNMYERNPLLASQNISQELVIGIPPNNGRKGGFIDQIKAISLDELRAQAAAYYKPANARIVVCGPVDPGKIGKRIKALYAGINPGKPAPAEYATPSFPNITLKFTEVTPLFKNSEPHVALSFRAPEPRDPSFPAFLVMVRRLQVNVEKLNLGPYTFQVIYAPLDRPEALSLVLPVKGPAAPMEVLKQIEKYVAEMRAKPLDGAEPKAARDYFNFAYRRETYPLEALARDPYGVAFSLGRTRQMGIDGEALMKKVEGTTPDEFARAAQRFDPSKYGAGAAIVEIKQ